ncbi:hypothetical protein BDV98DRAFT_657257, partial [Pterulicium gracile]
MPGQNETPNTSIISSDGPHFDATGRPMPRPRKKNRNPIASDPIQSSSVIAESPFTRTDVSDSIQSSNSIADRAKTRQRSTQKPKVAASYGEIIEIPSSGEDDDYMDGPPKKKKAERPKPKAKPKPKKKNMALSPEADELAFDSSLPMPSPPPPRRPPPQMSSLPPSSMFSTSMDMDIFPIEALSGEEDELLQLPAGSSLNPPAGGCTEQEEPMLIDDVASPPPKRAAKRRKQADAEQDYDQESDDWAPKPTKKKNAEPRKRAAKPKAGAEGNSEAPKKRAKPKAKGKAAAQEAEVKSAEFVEDDPGDDLAPLGSASAQNSASPPKPSAFAGQTQVVPDSEDEDFLVAPPVPSASKRKAVPELLEESPKRKKANPKKPAQKGKGKVRAVVYSDDEEQEPAKPPFNASQDPDSSSVQVHSK